jgi:hypothetical protein
MTEKLGPTPAEATCPSCAAPLSLEMVMQATAEQRMTYVIHLQDGAMMSARNIGKQLVAIGRLLEACANIEGGLNVQAMVSGLRYSFGGPIEFDLIMSQWVKAEAPSQDAA